MAKQPKLFPLTQSQVLMLYNMSFSFRKQNVNIVSVINFLGDVDPKLLLQATTLSMLRNEAASLRICKEGKQIMQYFSDAPMDPVEFYDFSDRTMAEVEQQYRAWGKIPFAKTSRNVQLHREKLVLKPDGKYSLFFCVNHIVFDAYSLMTNVRDIITIFIALRDGTPLPKPMPSPLPAYQADWDYEQSEQKKKDLEFWYDTFKTEPVYTSVNKLGGKGFVKGKRYGVTTRLIANTADFHNRVVPKALNDRVQAKAQEFRVSPQCLYLLAARTFFSRESGREQDVTIINTVARRATMAQKRAGGTLVHSVMFRSILEGSLSFKAACEKMQQYQSMYYRHADLSFPEMADAFIKTHKVPPLRGYQACVFTYQPYFVAFTETVPISFARIPNGVSATPLYLSIMPGDDSGDMQCNYEYNVGSITPQRLDEFHDFMLRLLDLGTQSPDLTLDQLMDRC